jgi:glutamine amidotransferase
MLFFLARTFGLEEDPRAALARAVGAVEETARQHSIAFPVQGTFATTDGETTWAVRYSSEGRSRSLFVSTEVATLREQHPDNPMLRELSDDARLIVSEPLGGLRGAWHEVPEATCFRVRGGDLEMFQFEPELASSVR